jgi:hypothetical protein
MRLDTVFAETLEQVQFGWPEYLAVQRIRIGIAEIGATMVVLAVLTVLARWTIFCLVRADFIEVPSEARHGFRNDRRIRLSN